MVSIFAIPTLSVPPRNNAGVEALWDFQEMGYPAISVSVTGKRTPFYLKVLSLPCRSLYKGISQL